MRASISSSDLNPALSNMSWQALSKLNINSNKNARKVFCTSVAWLGNHSFKDRPVRRIIPTPALNFAPK
jgi:hypothetical protein